MHRLVILSLLVFFVAGITRPTRARCPRGWWLPEGVRPSGVYECAPIRPARWVRTRRGGWIDASSDAASGFEGEIYCTGGAVPVVVDGVAVSCEARH